MASYSLLKQLHLTTLAITLALFVLRGIWMMTRSPQLHARWVRIVPHVNDTLLLASGIGLAMVIQQYPFAQGWLTAKFFALLLYIVLGTFALKDSLQHPLAGNADPHSAKADGKAPALRRKKTRRMRISAWVAALGVFGYMVAVAVTHDPFPILR